MLKENINIISWNVNGLRATLRKGFLDFVKKYQPDIICLQETKANREQVELDLSDYEEFWNSAEKKGYSGTAIFTKKKPLAVFNDVQKTLDKKILKDKVGRNGLNEGRIITAEFEKFFLVTVYTPNAKDNLERLNYRHKKWDPLFLAHCLELEKKKPVIFCGDLNVAHQEIDLARPKENIGNKGFTTEEREGFDNIIKAGFVDSFRVLHPDETSQYTWWSHWAKARERNVGWRIDYFLVSDKLKKNIKDAYILPEVLGSDHCPIGLTLTI